MLCSSPVIYIWSSKLWRTRHKDVQNTQCSNDAQHYQSCTSARVVMRALQLSVQKSSSPLKLVTLHRDDERDTFVSIVVHALLASATCSIAEYNTHDRNQRIASKRFKSRVRRAFCMFVSWMYPQFCDSWVISQYLFILCPFLHYIVSARIRYVLTLSSLRTANVRHCSATTLGMKPPLRSEQTVVRIQLCYEVRACNNLLRTGRHCQTSDSWSVLLFSRSP